MTQAPGPNGPLRVVIADDAALIRRGVALVLTSAGIEVAAQVGDAVELLAAVEKLDPDVAITDVRMPPDHRIEGLAAAVTIQQRQPRTAILLLSNHAEPSHVDTLLRQAKAGLGYLLKEAIVETEDFVDTVRRVAAGETVLAPEVIERLLTRRDRFRRLQMLTPREHEILAVMASGASNVTISNRLQLSPKTVETHVQHVFAKLGLGENPAENRRVRAVLAYLQGA